MDSPPVQDAWTRLATAPTVTSSLKKAAKAPLEILGFRLQSRWDEMPDAIRAFINLRVLVVRGVGLKRLPKWLPELAQLSVVDLSNNDAEMYRDLDVLCDLAALRDLTLHNFVVERLPLPQHLERLSLGYGELPPHALDNLPSLQELEIVSVPLTLLPPLPPTLETLEASQCRLTAASVAPAPRLRSLCLQFNELTGAPSGLETLRGLTRLRLDNNQIDGFPEAILALHALKDVDIGGNIVKIVPPEIDALKNLTSLFVTAAQLEALPQSIGALSSLEWLNVNCNSVKDLPEAVTELTELRLLYVKGNLLRRLPQGLARLQNLREVMLGGNPLPTAEIQRLRDAVPAASIDDEDAGLLMSNEELAARVMHAVLPVQTYQVLLRIPLRIAPGWLVERNAFFDTELPQQPWPIIEEGDIDATRRELIRLSRDMAGERLLVRLEWVLRAGRPGAYRLVIETQTDVLEEQWPDPREEAVERLEGALERYMAR